MADGAQGDVPQRAAPAEEQVALLELGKGLLVRRAALGEAVEDRVALTLRLRPTVRHHGVRHEHPHGIGQNEGLHERHQVVGAVVGQRPGLVAHKVGIDDVRELPAFALRRPALHVHQPRAREHDGCTGERHRRKAEPFEPARNAAHPVVRYRIGVQQQEHGGEHHRTADDHGVLAHEVVRRRSEHALDVVDPGEPVSDGRLGRPADGARERRDP